MLAAAGLLASPASENEHGVDFLLSVQFEWAAFTGLEIAQNPTELSVFDTASIICALRALDRIKSGNLQATGDR